MKSILDLFRSLGGGRDAAAQAAGATATVRKIVGELEAMEPTQARFIAAFAYLLGRVAHADFDISDEETEKMERIVQDFGDLAEEQAVLVVEIAKSQNRLFGGTENFQVAREFRDLSNRDQRRELLRCLFAVSAADDSISSEEEAQVRQIADELDLSHREYVGIRSEYNDQRSVIQRLGR